MRRVGQSPCVVTHGGAANVVEVKDGCERACDAALSLDALRRPARDVTPAALDLVEAAVVVLEDDERMNAGTGSVLRLPSSTANESVQMDAAVMDADGFGAVAVVENLKNPVKLARAVYASPHLMLAGAGANELAARLGLDASDPITERQRQRHAQRMQTLAAHPMWRGVPETYWRAHGAGSPEGGDCDTVGAVARDAEGRFAAAGSTGGLWCALRGRVGDVPIPGAGLWVGEAGAVAATGTGELIWREMLSRRCHDEMARGLTAQAAVDVCIAFMKARYPNDDVGLIAVDATGFGGGATGTMPWAAR